jgi:DNA-binding transcriptional MerR regulator
MDCYKQRDRYQNKLILNIMTSATDTDIQQIKDLIAAGNAATQKQITDSAIATQQQIADLDKKMGIGFTKIDGELKEVANRLVAVEASNKVIDGRLWGLIATLLGLTVTALLGIFVRFLFQNESIL